MKAANTDIDIDFANRDLALQELMHINATMQQKDKTVRHVSGVYFQNIPVHPLTGLASFDPDTAEQIGYFKIDFLNQSVYQGIRNEAHLDELLNKEPIWELLEDEAMVSQLIHIRNHFEIVQKIKPTSIEDLAVVLALIRPRKRYLINRQRHVIDSKIWNLDDDDGDGYAFRKAHAVSYAALVVVQMNLIVEQLLDDPISL